MKTFTRMLWAICLFLCFTPLANGQGFIGGAIFTEDDESLQNIPVFLSGSEEQVAYTNADGAYEFFPTTNGPFTITPFYNSNLLNGVSTFDLVFMTNHLDGSQPLDSPYKLIAADIDNSQSVNEPDTTMLRNMILFLLQELPNNTSWRFVDASYTFPDPMNPWETSFPESIEINNFNGQTGGLNFVGIKVGDINGSANLDLSFDPCDIACGHIYGNVFSDQDFNCALDAGDVPLENWIISATGTYDFVTTSDELGQYSLPVVPGAYVLEIFPPNDLWAPCQATHNVTINESDSTQIDLPIQAVVECPSMTVDIGTPLLRRCFSNVYTVQYCNQGTITATDVSVDVAFDDYLNVLSSSIPWDSQTDNTYTFSLPDVNIGECQFFYITAEVSCDATLGQTHCVEAHIFPDSLCLPPPELWDGANLEVEGECAGDSVYFDIKNIGDPMQEAVMLIVIEDHMIMREESIQLGSDENVQLGLPKNGSTWRLEVAQTTNHPESELVSATLEACGVNDQGSFSLGYVNQLSSYPGGAAIDIDCTENIGAYDPNDKQASPKGFSDDHWIRQNVDLEYHIRFQNTGTDTAFNVFIRDTISPWLDIRSVVPGAASHDYQFNLVDENVVEFRFNNIMLPDSNVNEAASHGFVKFNIAQEVDNPIGTLIENNAAIYFDFNEPIITNTVYHQVGEDFIGMLSSAHHVYVPNLEVKIFPNPVHEKAMIQLEGIPIKDVQFKLYDTLGRLVRQQRVNENSFELYKGSLSDGIYYFEIEQEGQRLSTGKLMMH